MTPETPLKARLAAGETLFGSFLTLGSPLAAEAMGLAGWDWLLVDLEHGGGHESQLLGQLLGAQAAGVHALARVESDARSRAARVLDLGVEGVMCPQVNSVEAAEAWARALHYGSGRGIALFHRGARFGTDPDALQHAAERTLGIAQIESPEAVEAVEGVAAVDRIDVVFVRPSDLSFSMGIYRPPDEPPFPSAVERVVGAGGFAPLAGMDVLSVAPSPLSFTMGIYRRLDEPRFRSAIERVVAAAEAAGKAAGIFLASPAEVERAVADGFRMIGIGSDGGYMLNAARAAVQQARRSAP